MSDGPTFSVAAGSLSPAQPPSAHSVRARVWQLLRDTMETVRNNPLVPCSLAGLVRQGLSSTCNLTGTWLYANPKGIEAAALALTYKLSLDSFSFLKQRAIKRALCQIAQLDVPTFISRGGKRYSLSSKLKGYLNEIKQEALAITQPQQARALQDKIKSGDKPWVKKLNATERTLWKAFKQQLLASLEEAAFWQPQSTLWLPLLHKAIPFGAVYVDETLYPATPAPSLPPAGQPLHSSPLVSGGMGEDAESFFDADHVQPIEVNLPGDFYQSPLTLSADQEFYTRLSRCPTSLKGTSADPSANFSIAAFGTPDNEAINLFLYSHQPLVINRALNNTMARFYSQINRIELQLAGSHDAPDDDKCPVPPGYPATPDDTLPVQQDLPLEVAAWWETALGSLNRFNFLPVVAGQDLDFDWENSPGDDDMNPAPLHNRFYVENTLSQPEGKPLVFDNHVTGPYDHDNNPAAMAGILHSEIVLPQLDALEKESMPDSLYPIDPADNQFERHKKKLIPFRVLRTTSQTTTSFPPTARPESNTRLHGQPVAANPPASSKPLIATDLHDMLHQAQQWVEQLPTSWVENKIHAFLHQSAANPPVQLTPLEETAAAVASLITGSDHQYQLDNQKVAKFSRVLFAHSRFAGNNEFLDTWARSTEGKQQLFTLLFNHFDRKMPDAGKLASTTFAILEQLITPSTTTFASLANIKIDLQNSFKKNLRSWLESAASPMPDFMANEEAVAKLQWLQLEAIKVPLPFFLLSNNPEVSDRLVLSTDGVNLTVAAGLIGDEDKLTTLSEQTLEKFALQALQRLSEDFLTKTFASYDRLLAKGAFRFMDVLNDLETTGGLLTQQLYLNYQIIQALQAGVVQSKMLIRDYLALADVEKQLCALALKDISASNQALFLAASRQPGGLEVRHLSMEITTDTGKQHHYLGAVLFATAGNTRHCTTLTTIPKLSDISADFAFDDSAHCLDMTDYHNWINTQGKMAFANRFAPELSDQLSAITFTLSEKMVSPAAGPQQSWSQYSDILSRSMTDKRFPLPATSSPSPTPDRVDAVLDIANALVNVFIPISSCQQALKALIDLRKKLTAKLVMVAAGKAGVCFYDLLPVSKESKLEKFLQYFARSWVWKKLTQLGDDNTRTNQAPLDINDILAQLLATDGEVLRAMLQSPMFHNDLGWKLHQHSLDLEKLPPEVLITGVRWNYITDQIYCRIKTSQGIKNYRFDNRNLILLPTDHQFTDFHRNNPEISFSVANFLSHATNHRLDSLKNESLAQEKVAISRKGVVSFKHKFVELDFKTTNIVDTIFSNLAIPPGWQPVNIWIKTDEGGSWLVELKNGKDQTRYQQYSEWNNQFFDWLAGSLPTGQIPQRDKRDGTTPKSWFTQVLTPADQGYKLIKDNNDPLRIAEVSTLFEKATRGPNPTIPEEIECRSLMQELVEKIPAGFFKDEYPEAQKYVRDFGQWAIDIDLGAGFKHFSTLVDIYGALFPDDTRFLPYARKFRHKAQELYAKNINYLYYFRSLKDGMADYYEKHIEPRVLLNTSLNKITDIKNSPGIPGAPQYISRTKTLQDMVAHYPETNARIKDVLSNVHTNAKLVKKLLLSDKGYQSVFNTLLNFTKEVFAEDEVRSVLADQIRYQNVLLSIKNENFIIFDERYTSEGDIANNCYIDHREEALFSEGVEGFVVDDDKHKKIYIKDIKNKNKLKQTILHEVGHLNDNERTRHQSKELYTMSYHPTKHISTTGVEKYSRAILSDKYLFVDYLMRDHEFLDRYCKQMQEFSRDANYKRKINNFSQKYPLKYAWSYDDRYSVQARTKRTELTEIVDMMRSNHSLLKQFLYHNADWMVGMQNHFIDLAKTFYPSAREGSEDSGFGDDEDLYNNLVKKAATILLGDVNEGASTSGNANSARAR